MTVTAMLHQLSPRDAPSYRRELKLQLDYPSDNLGSRASHLGSKAPGGMVMGLILVCLGRVRLL